LFENNHFFLETRIPRQARTSGFYLEISFEIRIILEGYHRPLTLSRRDALGLILIIRYGAKDKVRRAEKNDSEDWNPSLKKEKKHA
jgi:hypothetical protein